MCADICEHRHLGDIPKFRGPSPWSFRPRGLPQNPGEQEFTIGNQWKYVTEGKMCVCTSRGIQEGVEFSCSSSTTVAKKLPGRTISSDKRLIWTGEGRISVSLKRINGGSIHPLFMTWPSAFAGSAHPALVLQFSGLSGISMRLSHGACSAPTVL